MPDVSRSQILEVDARASLRSYLTLGTIFLLLTLFGLLVAIKTPAHDWNFVYIPAAIGLGVVLWLRTIRLTIADGELSYHTLFGIRSIRISDIEKAETQLIGTSKGQYRALVVHPYPASTRKPMRVHIGAFSREDLGRLFDLLSPKFKGPRNIGVYTDESV
jgi:hypothetical protein